MLIPRSLRFRFLKLYHGSLFCIHFPAMTSIRSFFWQREFRWAQRPGRETDKDVGFRCSCQGRQSAPAAQASIGDAPRCLRS